ncbi:MAG: hypothetical protein AAGN66_09415 [Acidobacteriota bacterium]
MLTKGLFERLIPLLERADIPYMVAGSVASSVHGSPRSTQDVDLVIAPDRSSLLRLLQSLPHDAYYFSEESALRAFARNGQFNIIDFETGWKVDFILRKARPFSKLEFERRQMEMVGGVQLFVARPEDVVITKLEWAQMSASDRQISDAAGILRVQGQDLDLPYIEHWVAELGLVEELGRARAAAEV